MLKFVYRLWSAYCQISDWNMCLIWLKCNISVIGGAQKSGTVASCRNCLLMIKGSLKNALSSFSKVFHLLDLHKTESVFVWHPYWKALPPLAFSVLDSHYLTHVIARLGLNQGFPAMHPSSTWTDEHVPLKFLMKKMLSKITKIHLNF